MLTCDLHHDAIGGPLHVNELIGHGSLLFGGWALGFFGFALSYWLSIHNFDWDCDWSLRGHVARFTTSWNTWIQRRYHKLGRTATVVGRTCLKSAVLRFTPRPAFYRKQSASLKFFPSLRTWSTHHGPSKTFQRFWVLTESRCEERPEAERDNKGTAKNVLRHQPPLSHLFKSL